MNYQNYKALFLVVSSVLVLLVASPALERLLVYPQTDFFTEMWLLGPEHTADNYPINITRNTNYNVFLGIGNQLGRGAYYQVEVKFRNQTQSVADNLNRKSSSSQPLYIINAFVGDNQAWEIPISFSFNYVHDNYNVTHQQARFTGLTFNGNALDLKEYSALWDDQRNGFFGNLFFELWIYNDTAGVFQYHERRVGLWLNMTGP